MKEINRVFYVCLFFSGIILNVSWPAHVRAATPRPLRVAYMSTSATMASLWMAKETGAIAKEGVDVEVLTLAANVAIPALIAGSAITGAISMVSGIQLLVPHGGIFAALIPGAVSNLFLYAIAILVGTVVTAGVLFFIKRPVTEPMPALA